MRHGETRGLLFGANWLGHDGLGFRGLGFRGLGFGGLGVYASSQQTIRARAGLGV